MLDSYPNGYQGAWPRPDAWRALEGILAPLRAVYAVSGM
jgi:hypothetical protein